MPSFAVGDWVVGLGFDGREQLAFVVRRAGELKPLQWLDERLEPGPSAGFQPGVAVIPETAVLFLGSGRNIRALNLSDGQWLWQEQTEVGFLGWARHGDVVLMSGELELAAYDLRARRLWSQFVEPPWTYAVVGQTVELDVMGHKSRFPLQHGP